MRISVIIPTRNEASALPRVLSDLPVDLVNEVLVVDSNSTDGTPAVAGRMGARVIAERRRGYGQAGFVANFQIGNLGTVETYVDHADQPLQGPPVSG